jgi:alkanesulfonate monooxygenase SsuD/methylene tetrahydromethanopterin reductase-like flavin-dependent oxidoreductase (luciferase family)
VSTGQQISFGIIHGFHRFDLAGLAEEARHAESLGYDFFSMPDHLHTDQPTAEPWTALTWAAAATHRLRVLPNVLGLPYRAPAVTAKMAETLDRLSGGRLVLGLGLGGYDAEFSAFGLAERTPGEKVAALREALTIIRGVWSEQSFSFEGQHFAVRQARIEPKPANRIPVWLGSYGPRSLRLTGELADGWIPSLGRLGLDQAVAMREAVLGAAKAAGRDPAEITCATNLVVAFGDDGAETPRAGWRQVSGGSQAIAGRLAEIGRAGFTVINVALPDGEARERFAAEVVPLVRRDRG